LREQSRERPDARADLEDVLARDHTKAAEPLQNTPVPRIYPDRKLAVDIVIVKGS